MDILSEIINQQQNKMVKLLQETVVLLKKRVEIAEETIRDRDEIIELYEKALSLQEEVRDSERKLLLIPSIN